MDLLSSDQPRFITRGETYRVVNGESVILPCQAENLSKNSIETNKIFAAEFLLSHFNSHSDSFGSLKVKQFDLTFTFTFTLLRDHFTSLSHSFPPPYTSTLGSSSSSTSFWYLWASCPKFNFSIKSWKVLIVFPSIWKAFLSLCFLRSGGWEKIKRKGKVSPIIQSEKR